MVLDRFRAIVQRLQATASRLEKKKILEEILFDNPVADLLWFLLNPYIVTGISDKKIGKARKSLPLLAGAIDVPKDLPELTEYFMKNTTGRDADVDVLHAFADKHDADRELIYALIKKDLRLGLQAKTFNDVFGASTVPTMDVMLAESFAENQAHLNGREFVVTQKLDGVRAVLIFNNDRPTFYSRGGRPIEDLIELSEQAMRLDQSYVYDGELLLSNPNESWTAAEIYRATVKVTASDGVKTGIDFHIFDRLRKVNFLGGISHVGALERKQTLEDELAAIKNAPNLKNVEILYHGSDMGQISVLMDKHTANGEEGLMVSPADSPYECKRTKNLLKVKKFHTADVLVLSIEEGGGANRGKLGAVHVRFIGPDGKHHTCKVGSGFSQEERERYFASPDEIIGKIIEIGYFELSKNQNDDNYSLRFPTFKHVRHDKIEISMH